MSKLIYDIGMDHGDDTAFYLRKGFRVVAVEADPELCERAAHRFRQPIADGQLTLVNRAIAPVAGPVTFYRSTTRGWGTVVEDWNRENLIRGVARDSIVVDGMTLADLIDSRGEPFYLKVDIEGMDLAAVQSLSTTEVRPRYLSMETSFARSMDFRAIEEDFETLTDLGYDRFKIVDQDSVDTRLSGPSGAFGEESPGQWLSGQAALDSFRAFCRKMWLPLLLYRNRRIFLYYSRAVRRLYGKCPNLSWYDIHAKHSSLE